eukprot:TRINITY_DN15460_c0_g1_i1.p1 TRINITY_DN15460_c0_g1~~TRINITY_DN15460_c0_g1_i1.p1  ORF type:complete len:308 (+),score=70.98 TRINITY_DN15460_c0_g1_i1:68-991(+)
MSGSAVHAGGGNKGGRKQFDYGVTLSQLFPFFSLTCGSCHCSAACESSSGQGPAIAQLQVRVSDEDILDEIHLLPEFTPDSGDGSRPRRKLPEAEIDERGDGEQVSTAGFRDLEVQNTTLEVRIQVTVDSMLGLDVSMVTDNHLLVKRVEDGGGVAAYNSERPSQEKVQRGDRIMAVNDEPGLAEELLKKLETISDEIVLKLEKPRLLGLVIHQDREELGLELEASQIFLGGVVKRIRADGCVDAYNQIAPPAQRLKKNDLVIGTFFKDDEGQITLQRMNSCAELEEYMEQDGPFHLSVFSYSCLSL